MHFAYHNFWSRRRDGMRSLCTFPTTYVAERASKCKYPLQITCAAVVHHEYKELENHKSTNQFHAEQWQKHEPGNADLSFSWKLGHGHEDTLYIQQYSSIAHNIKSLQQTEKFVRSNLGQKNTNNANITREKTANYSRTKHPCHL